MGGAAEVAGEDGDQSIGRGCGNRLEQQPVDRAEDRRVGPDPQGERGDGHHREAGGAPQESRAEAEILEA